MPLGVVEQHGHQLPLSTGTWVACAAAESAMDAFPGALLAPALPYRASGEHEGFPGTISIGTEGRDVAWFPCGVPGGDAHAGRTETSLMLHVEPDAVRGGRAALLADLVDRLVEAGRSWRVDPVGRLVG